MRATLKEGDSVLIDVLGDPDEVAEDFADELNDLLLDLPQTDELSIPIETTWTVVVSS
jgi:hypothetical protein